MTQWAIVYPLLAQVLLTFVMLLWMGVARVGAVRRGEVRVSQVALGQQAWPDHVTKIANTFHNQFQTPVLFYLAILLAMVAGKVSMLLVILCWLFVASRIAHATIYTTTNRIRHRFGAFAVGVFILIIIWLVLASAIVFEGGV